MSLFGQRDTIINALKDLNPAGRSKSRSRSRDRRSSSRDRRSSSRDRRSSSRDRRSSSRDRRSSSSGSSRSGGGDNDEDAIKAALKEIDMDKYAKDII